MMVLKRASFLSFKQKEIHEQFLKICKQILKNTFTFIVITLVLFDRSTWNKDKIPRKYIIYWPTKIQEDRFNGFLDFLGLSQLYDDKRDVLHVFLPHFKFLSFPIATWQTNGLPCKDFINLNIFRHVSLRSSKDALKYIK